MATGRRRKTWIVVSSEDGTFELQLNGRGLASGLSERTLQQRMTRAKQSTDRILREDPDGYRTPARLSDFIRSRRKG